jgi:hypothetical protein
MSQNQAAVVDAKGVYLGMFVEGAEIPEGARRLPQIQECDLQAGEYAWVDDQENPFGGFFWPVKKKLVIAPGVK